MNKPQVVVLLALAGLTGWAVVAAAREGGGEPAPESAGPAAAAEPKATAAAKRRRFPNRATTGVPRRWKPARVRRRDLTVSRPGAVIKDVVFKDADLLVDAPNVTVKRVKMQGGGINNVPSGACRNGLVVKRTTFEPPPGRFNPVDEQPAIVWGGYTARGIEIQRRGEGLFVSGKQDGCGPVRIKRSFLKLVLPDAHCGPGTDDWHTDGIQGYGGDRVVVRNTTIDFREASCGTAAFFYPHSQGNTSARIDRLLVLGGGYPFRLGMPARVTGLKIANRSWAFGPIDVKCSVMGRWAASIVEVTKRYQVARKIRRQPCNTEAGG